MRLFIASSINFDNYMQLKNEFRELISGKWVDEKNLHLTHLFIGDDEPNKYKNIKLNIPKDKIVINGLGNFGDKVLFLNVINKSAKSINTQLQKTLNKKIDYKPHITLCRIKNIKNKDSFKKLINSYKIHFEVEYKVYLYQSILTPKGPIYKKIYEYR